MNDSVKYGKSTQGVGKAKLPMLLGFFCAQKEHYRTYWCLCRCQVFDDKLSRYWSSVENPGEVSEDTTRRAVYIYHTYYMYIYQ